MDQSQATNYRDYVLKHLYQNVRLVMEEREIFTRIGVTLVYFLVYSVIT